MKEMMRLQIAANAKIKINPYRIAVPKLFDSIFLSPFVLYPTVATCFT
ncbi:hypothetical protein [Bacillus rubiinfantis]|nr:hypothetical protein [Bacillus rubiinfantis]